MTTPYSITDRQAAYYAKQAAILQALDLLRQQVLAHGAKAAAAQYHGGTLDELTAAQRQLAALLPWLNS